MKVASATRLLVYKVVSDMYVCKMYNWKRKGKKSKHEQ